MKKGLILITLSLMVLACSISSPFSLGGQGAKTPRLVDPKKVEFVKHENPLKGILAEVPATDCVENERGEIECPEGSALYAAGCHKLMLVEDASAELNPLPPMMYCGSSNMGSGKSSDYSLFVNGCLAPTFYSLVVWNGQELQVLKNAQEAADYFAPIESPEEALAFAVTVTHLEAKFSQQAEPDMRYLVKKVEDTHVVKTAEGYQVNLFGFNICGCGNHGEYERTLVVKQDGSLVEKEIRMIYEDPQMDNMCID